MRHSLYDMTSHNGKLLVNIGQFECFIKTLLFRGWHAVSSKRGMKSPTYVFIAGGCLFVQTTIRCLPLPGNFDSSFGLSRVLMLVDNEIKTKKRAATSCLRKPVPTSIAFCLTFRACNTCRGILMTTHHTKVWKVYINVA